MNAIIRLNRQLRCLFITLLLACFAVVQSVQAEPNEADPSDNVAEENDAVLDLTAAAGNARINGKEKNPNQWTIRMDFTDYVRPALEKVRFRGELVVKFRVGTKDFFGVKNKFAGPADYLLRGLDPKKPFSALGTGKKPTLGRTYRLKSTKGTPSGKPFAIDFIGGSGSFQRNFEFTAQSNLPGKQKVEFTLKFPISYEFNKQGRVIRVEARPEINQRGLGG
jgi:hypothetical protein